MEIHGFKGTSRRARPVGKNGQRARPRSHPGAEADQGDMAPAPAGWLVQCPPGLAASMKREMTHNQATERKQSLFISRQRNHDLLFVNKVRSDAGLEKLRIAEMMLHCPVYGRYKLSQRQLNSMAESLKKTGPRRLVVSVTGRHFQRHDLSRFIEREMEIRGYNFSADVEAEVWMFCIDEAYYFGMPLRKARDVEGRDLRETERPGSLPPPVAAAIAFALGPKDDDVVLDPCCGSGTLLAEFRAYAPGAKLVGVDIDAAAIAAARANLKSAGGGGDAGQILGDGVDLKTGDSRSPSMLSEYAGKVTAVVANLPFGLQFGRREDNPKLYRGIIETCLHLRHPKDFRALLFTSDGASLQAAVDRLNADAPTKLRIEEALRVKVRGELAIGFKLLI